MSAPVRIINPQTGRTITVGGTGWKRLLRTGVVDANYRVLDAELATRYPDGILVSGEKNPPKPVEPVTTPTVVVPTEYTLPWDFLPLEIWNEILRKLNPLQKMRVKRVCHDWKALIKYQEENEDFAIFRGVLPMQYYNPNSRGTTGHVSSDTFTLKNQTFRIMAPWVGSSGTHEGIYSLAPYIKIDTIQPRCFAKIALRFGLVPHRGDGKPRIPPHKRTISRPFTVTPDLPMSIGDITTSFDTYQTGWLLWYVECVVINSGNDYKSELVNHIGSVSFD